MIKVFLVCCGLGHVERGYESFTQECFEILSSVSEFEVKLFKGRGSINQAEKLCWNLSRHSWIAEKLGSFTGRDAYFVEQVSFTLNLIPHIQRHQPNVIYFSDGTIGNVLWHWRRLAKQKFKLLFSNGGPHQPPFMPRCDHIQQLTPTQLYLCTQKGIPTDQQSLVPYGIKVPDSLNILSSEGKRALKRKLQLPEEKPIVLSVGAINRHHKRMNYLIEEIAALPEPRPYLLLLGQQDSRSAEIKALGIQLLGSDCFEVKTTTHRAIKDYYAVADVFVLASLHEGLPRVLLEAMSFGLPCIAHDYEVTGFVLGKYGYFGDFTRVGTIRNLVGQVLSKTQDYEEQRRRFQSISQRFGWHSLEPTYADMILRCAKGSDGSL